MLRNVSVCKDPDCLALWQPGFMHCPTCHGELRRFGTEPTDRDHPRAGLFGTAWFDAVARSVENDTRTTPAGVVVSFDPDEAEAEEVEREPVGAGSGKRKPAARPSTREA